MPSHSSFTYNGSSNGLGRLIVSSETQQIYDQQRTSQPTRLPVRNSGRSTAKPVVPTRTIQPIVTTSVPTTGGSYPILTQGSGGGNQSSNENKPASSYVTLDGDHLVIAGDHRIKKKKAIMVGTGLAGTAILLKTIL